MIEPMLDPTHRSLSLAQEAILAAMIAGAVSGALAGWLSKRNVGLSLCTFMIGIMGGLLVGTGMARWLYISPDGVETVVNAGWSSLGSAVLAGLAGSLPTALLIPSMVIFIALRHVKQRPSRVKTGLQAMSAGTLTAVVAAALRLIV